MCGITGILTSVGSEQHSALHDMTAAINHRGPDASGMWSDTSAGIYLGHRRLSILDLSDAGKQPMRSADGRVTIVYNGEIYNFRSIRREIEETGHHFRGHSDSEVLVEALARWGATQTLRKLNGIFAFAAWDHTSGTLTLARDHMGVKPMYWGRLPNGWAFGSELKALRQHPQFSPEIDRNALAAYLRFGYVPQPYSIYKNAHKLAPGTQVHLQAGHAPRHTIYWSALENAQTSAQSLFAGTDAEATDALEDQLQTSIARQMVSDVPLGAFLSGGIDSSTVAAVMQSVASKPVRTFSIGFNEQQYNEAKHASAVADHLGTDHTELYVTADQARDVIPLIPDMYDEPFADSSQIPTYLVCKMTRDHVTVALSGDGGDELFAGYNRYFWAERIWRSLSWAPVPLRSAIASMIRAVPTKAYDALTAPFGSLMPAQSGDKAHKLSHLLALKGPNDLYRQLVSQWQNPGSLLDGGTEPSSVLDDPALSVRFPYFTQRMQATDLVTYLPDDILTKVDRASMSVALEARVPLLDPELVSFAWNLPMHMKVRNGQGKWLLRQVLYRHVPQSLIDRPKMGFGVPIDDWLRGPLREWAEDLLSEEKLLKGTLNPAPIRAAWQDHLSGRKNLQHSLWVVLMWQAWADRWL